VKASGLAVPSTALLFGAQGTRVALAVDGKVRLVPVKVGRDLGKTLLVEEGLKPADQVLANPSPDLAEGTPVVPQAGEKKL
jgi:hypothetical protein